MATLKIQSAEIEPFWATPEILLFLRMRFSNIFLTYMVWKYQNEIAPTFYYGISTKTNEKDLKIPNLQHPDWKHPYWMSLYYYKPSNRIWATKEQRITDQRGHPELKSCENMWWRANIYFRLYGTLWNIVNRIRYFISRQDLYVHLFSFQQ